MLKIYVIHFTIFQNNSMYISNNNNLRTIFNKQ